jgi:hypothetical protein
MSNLGGMTSLGSATSSNLDSSCKHIQQCRVSQDHMIQFTKAPHDPEELVRNKYRYCVHKDEIALSVGKCWGKQNGTKRFQNNAYPRVVSNLGQLVECAGDERSEAEKLIKLMYHHVQTIPERDKFLAMFQSGVASNFVTGKDATPYLKMEGDIMAFKAQLPYIYDFGASGYANTVGWAHSSSGDTMSSVMIGGLRTVTNGDFEVFCGDRIQWYWPFEAQCFTKDGRRKRIEMHTDAETLAKIPGGIPPNNLQMDPALSEGQGHSFSQGADVRQRKAFEERQYGQRQGSEKIVPLIKPFKRDDEQPRLYDWYRVFADAISSAGPREKVDIRISRQAL